MSFGLLLKHSNTSAYNLQGNVIYCSIEHTHGDIVFLSTGLKSSTVCFRSELQKSLAVSEARVKWTQPASPLVASVSTTGSRPGLREVQVNTRKGGHQTQEERLSKDLFKRESGDTDKRYPTVLLATMVQHSAEHHLSSSTQRSSVLPKDRSRDSSGHLVRPGSSLSKAIQAVHSTAQSSEAIQAVRSTALLSPQEMKGSLLRLATPSVPQIWNERNESLVTSIRAPGVRLSGSNEPFHSTAQSYALLQKSGRPNEVRDERGESWRDERSESTDFARLAIARPNEVRPTEGRLAIARPLSSFAQTSGSCHMVGVDNVELLGEPKLVLPKTLYKRRKRLLVWAKLSKMWRTGHRLRGFILNSVKGGYAVAIAGYIAFLPRSLIQDTHIFRNQWRRFAILNMKPRIRNIVVKDLGLTRKGAGGGRVRGPKSNSTEMKVRTRRTQSKGAQSKRGDTRGGVFRSSRPPSTGESRSRVLNSRTSSPRVSRSDTYRASREVPLGRDGHANATKQGISVNLAARNIHSR